MFILFHQPGDGVDFQASDEDYLNRVKEIVGDGSIPVEILGVSKWFISETVAEYYSICPYLHIILITLIAFVSGMLSIVIPSSTGSARTLAFKNAFNLAWKLASVEK
jgi:hypothetical protein